MTPLALLFILTFLVSVDVRILGPVLPSIAGPFHRVRVRLALQGRPAGRAVTPARIRAHGSGQLVYGPLSDHFGRIAVVRVAAVRFGRAW